MTAKLFGLYERDHRALRHLTADEVPVIIAWAGTTVALLAPLLPLTPAEALGGAAAAEFAVAAALLGVSLRSLARWSWWKLTPPEVVGMVGDEAGLAAMRRKLDLFHDMHLELAGELKLGTLGRDGERSAELRGLAAGVDRIIVAGTHAQGELIEQLTLICREMQVKLSVVSPLRGRALPLPQISRLADLAILEYNTWDPSRSTLLLKRLFDVTVASLLLLLTLPLLPIVALAIRLDSKGPVIFSQIRAGFGGRPFRMYKLRTMECGAEASLEGIIDFAELDEPAFKIRQDPRVTRTGRWLRRLSLDELPQLVNVLVGEMSIVGPRPEQIELVSRYTREDRVRLTVKPGITGPMQIYGRGELTFAERLAVEIEYVENPSLARDLRIIMHTAPAVLRGTGAY
jgi:exopolysaccharide biosynthesis polyprenyl glycosylphosphotransferase